jgi:4'-phosphopantetheinyl transferase
MLSQQEAHRLHTLRRAADRARFATGAVLVRELAGARLQRHPARVIVERACPTCARPHGRPRLPGTGLHVSVTHSADRVGVAMTRAGEVGLDVEEVVSRDVLALSAHVLGPGEALIDPEDFFTYWVRKEAVVKATGDGLTARMDQVLVSAPSSLPALVRYADRTITVQMSDLYLGSGYRAAVAVLCTSTVLVRQRFREEPLHRSDQPAHTSTSKGAG